MVNAVKGKMKGRWIRKSSDGSAAVVFIHGVLSDEKCWVHENGTFWPDVITKERSVTTAGVYVFEYNTGFFSGTYRLGDVVDALKTQLRLDKVDQCRTIVFVCHSMGGIVARRYIVQNELELVQNKKCVGLFLIASPSLGSEYANWLSPIAKWFKHSQADALRFSQANAWLLDLDKDFMNLKERGKLKLFGKELVEDRFITLKWFVFRQVVPPFSGARYFGDAFKVPASDHFSIAKIASASDNQHRILVEFLKPVAVPSLDNQFIKMTFRDQINADLISCNMAVQKLFSTEDPVHIDWPIETLSYIETLRDLDGAIQKHLEPDSVFYGIDQESLADFASNVSAQLRRIDCIQAGVIAGTRRLVRGMKEYWGLENTRDASRSLSNFLTLSNLDIITNTVALFRFSPLYERYYPKELDWFIPLRSRQIYARLLGIDGPLALAKISNLSGVDLQPYCYFWGPRSDVVLAAEWKEGETIKSTWFEKFLIPQNELDQVINGKSIQFKYDERMTIIKVIDEDGHEIA